MRTFSWRGRVRALDPDPDAPEVAYRFSNCREFFQPRRDLTPASRPTNPPTQPPVPDDGKCFLLDEDGGYVLNGQGGRIEIPCTDPDPGSGGGPIIPPSSGPYDHLPPGAVGRGIDEVQINLPAGSSPPTTELNQYKVGDLLAIENVPSEHYVLEHDSNGNKVWIRKQDDDEGSGSVLPTHGTAEFGKYSTFLLHGQAQDQLNGWWRKNETKTHWVQIEKPAPITTSQNNNTSGSGPSLPSPGDATADNYQTFLLYGQADLADNGWYQKYGDHWVKVTD